MPGQSFGGRLCRWPEEEEKKEEAKVYNFHPDDYDDWIPDGWATSTADRQTDREEWGAVTLGAL